MILRRAHLLSSLCLFVMAYPVAANAQAQQIPAPAGAERIQPVRPLSLPDNQRRDESVSVPPSDPQVNAPEGSEKINVHVSSFTIEGVTAFNEKELHHLYGQYVGHEMPLNKLWEIAEKITQLYRSKGYFLSRAYIPGQEVDKGNLKINVVEGYVGIVENDLVSSDRVFRGVPINELETLVLKKKPLKAKQLEEFVLRLNDTPGRTYKAILKPLPEGPEGSVKLVLVSKVKQGTGVVTADNFSSRFLGPYTGAVTYRDSFIPGQETGVTVGTSIPTRELNYVALDHVIPLSVKGALELSGTRVDATPGYTLRPFEIESKSTNLRVGYRYKAIRQWDENLTFGFGFTHHNIDGDILSTTLTRDRIRAIEAKVNYDTTDRWNGYNAASAIVRRGLKVLGSSRENDLDLSRAEATPDFTTLGIQVMHQHALGKGFVGTARAAGQLASGPLFSAEEFGYGGQSFGRAYDPSEIIGDQGVSGAVELAYAGLKPHNLGKTTLTTVPFVFYDIGKIWNKDFGAVPESGSSAGVGVRLNHSSGLSGQLGIAQPLTRQVDTPLNGGNGKNPRILLQMTYGF